MADGSERRALSEAFDKSGSPELAERIRKLTRLNESHCESTTVARAIAFYECVLLAMVADDAKPHLHFPDGRTEEIEFR